tara:strand:- start:865 stop:1071 length:207 start_codon:yes stop_codon:yes gene_type:complete
MNKVNKLNDSLLDQLMDDLQDPMKCTPGLYQVIRGIINDNRADLDSLPQEVLKELQNISEKAPFQFGS